jgi:hypothetical protein
VSNKTVNIGENLSPEKLEAARSAANEMIGVGEKFSGVFAEIGPLLDELEQAEIEMILKTGGSSEKDVETILEARRSIHAIRGLRSKIQERVNLTAVGKNALKKMDDFEKANRPKRGK